MAFTIVWSEKAASQLEKLPLPIRKAIHSKVGGLAVNPFTGSVKKLHGNDAFRLRVGDYRVVFDIEKSELRIHILFLGHRKNIYKRLGLQ
jgi:mRNA interferase RelE/StbE